MRANLVVLSMAWMTREDGRVFSRMPQEPDMDSLMYWVTRLEPIIRSETGDEVIVVFANRTGNENQAIYAGTSAVMGIKNGRVSVYGILGRGDKELLVVDTNDAPYATLVYRPEAYRVEDSTRSDINLGRDSENSARKKKSRRASSSTSARDKETLSSVHTDMEDSKRNSPKTKRSTSARESRGKLSLQADLATLNSVPKEDWGVHTPTCPSPTPMSIRPRLVIPPATSITMRYLESQFPTPHPIALMSAQAEHFPSEDLGSRSAGPVSAIARPDEPIQIFGGRVTVSQYKSMPSASSSNRPKSHFSDASPEWVTSNGHLEAPVRSRGQTTAAESDIASISEADLVEHHCDVNATHPDYQTLSRQSQRSRYELRPASVDISSRKKALVNIPPTDDIKTSLKTDPMPDRPSSPKSRNASRSREPERPGSAIDPATNLEAISRILKEIGERVGTNQGHSKTMHLRSQSAHRLQGSKTSTKLSECESNTMIPIGTYSSLSQPHWESNLRTDAQDSGETLVARRQSMSNLCQSGPGYLPQLQQPDEQGVNGRTVSRGRQPHARESSLGRSGPLAGTRVSLRRRQSASTEPVDRSQFRLIEQWISPGCPLHGSPPNSVSENHGSPAPRPSASREPDIAATTFHAIDPARSPSLIARPRTSAPSVRTADTKKKPRANLQLTEHNAPCLSASIETMAFGTPSPESIFEPQTPKAMMLIHDLDSSPVQETDTKDVEKLTELDISRPKSAIW